MRKEIIYDLDCSIKSTKSLGFVSKNATETVSVILPFYIEKYDINYKIHTVNGTILWGDKLTFVVNKIIDDCEFYRYDIVISNELEKALRGIHKVTLIIFINPKHDKRIMQTTELIELEIIRD
jgi:hypothetical protein